MNIAENETANTPPLKIPNIRNLGTAINLHSVFCCTSAQNAGPIRARAQASAFLAGARNRARLCTVSITITSTAKPWPIGL